MAIELRPQFLELKRFRTLKGTAMAYELHIERDDGFLYYDDWLKAIEAVDGVRLFSPENYPQYNNPDPDVTPSWHEPEGTAEMKFENEWFPVFHWHGGRVTFKLGEYMEEVLEAALALAGQMNATVHGDEGEVYTSVRDLIPPEYR